MDPVQLVCIFQKCDLCTLEKKPTGKSPLVMTQGLNTAMSELGGRRAIVKTQDNGSTKFESQLKYCYVRLSRLPDFVVKNLLPKQVML